MQSNDKVGIVVPVYNIEPDTLEKGITSLMNQTVSPWEVVIVDDGSNEDTANKCDDLGEMFAKIKIHHQENKGVSAARNAGINALSGNVDWIMFFDPDDYLELTALELLLKNSNEFTDIVCCSCNVITEKGIVENPFFNNNKCWKTVDDKRELIMQLFSDASDAGGYYTAIGVPWGKLYRYSFIKNSGIRFNEKCYRMQDNIFNMWAFALSDEVVYLNSPLYVYDYGHISNLRYKYDENIESLYKTLWAERESFLDMYYYDDEILHQEFYSLVVGNVYNICRRSIFNEKANLCYSQRIDILEELLSVEAVQISLSKYDAKCKDNWKKNIRFRLLRSKNYPILYCFFKAEYALAKVKNYLK